MMWFGWKQTSIEVVCIMFGIPFLLATVSAQNNTVAGVCSQAADVIFVVDSSVSVREACPVSSSGGVGGDQPPLGDNWKMILSYISQVVSAMPIGTNRTRVGVVTFSTVVDDAHVITLDSYNDTSALVGRIMSLPFIGRNTNMTGALRHVRQMFADARIAEPSSTSLRHQIAVLLTDGMNNVDADPIHESRLVKQDGVTLLVVGVSDYIVDAELREIASPPADYSFLYAQDFGHLNRLVGQTLDRLVCSNLAIQPCTYSRIDIALLLDSSGSIGVTANGTVDITGGINWELMTNFVITMIQNLRVSAQETRVALIRFSAFADIIFNFTTSSAEAIQAISKMNYVGSSTNTAEALDIIIQVMASGARRNVKKVGIVITDGQSSNTSSTRTEARKAKDAGIEMFAIGLTDSIDADELKAIASLPLDTHYYNRTTYALVGTVTSQLLWSVCRGDCSPVNNETHAPAATTSSTVSGQQSCANGTSICAPGQQQTWDAYPGHLLLGLSYATLNYVTSVSQCQAYCLQDIACRSIEYISSMQSCSISYYTMDMAPADSFRADSGVDYYERICTN